MATTTAIPTPTPADIAPRITPRPTAPLSPAAVTALASLERRLSGRTVADVLAHEASNHARISPEVEKAVARFEAASARYNELVARPASGLSSRDFDALRASQKTVAETSGVLAAAGMLHLIGGA